LRHRLADGAGNAGLSEGANAATANSPPAWLPPVRVVSAQSGAGIEGLLGFMRAHRIFLESAGGLVSWQRRRVIARYRQAIQEELHARLSCEWRHRLEHDEAAVADGLMMPASAAQRFCARCSGYAADVPETKRPPTMSKDFTDQPEPASNSDYDRWLQRHAGELART